MSTTVDAVADEIRLQREAIPMYEVERRSLEEIGYSVGIGRKRLVRLLKEGIGEDRYIALAKGRQKGGHGSKGPHKRHRQPVTGGRCTRCGMLVAESGLSCLPLTIDTGYLCLPCWYRERTGRELTWADESKPAYHFM